MSFKLTRTLMIVTILACAATMQIARSADSVAIQNVKTATATVESIEAEKDLVWLRGADGRSFTVVISPELRNSKNIKVGDRLIVHYKDSLVAAVKRRGSRATRDEDQRAAPANQNVVSHYTYSRKGIIQSVNTSSHSIAYKDAEGFSRNATVTNPDAQKFVETLKPGDEVEVTYAEAFAVSVEREK